MFFGMAGGMGFQNGTGGIFNNGGIFGNVGGDGTYIGSIGDMEGGGGSWWDRLPGILIAGGTAVEKAAGAITGNQGQYTQQRFQPMAQQPQVIYRNANTDPDGNPLSLDRTAGEITGFLSRNIIPVGIFVVGLMLFRSGRK